MKASHCLLASMCISLLSYGQGDLDSLKVLLAKARAENQSNREAYQLFQIGYYFYQANQFDSAIRFYSEVLKKNPKDALRASSLNGLGVVYSSMGTPDRSIPYYNEAILIFEQLRDTNSVVTTGYNLAIIYKDKGMYDDALEVSFGTLAKLEKQPPNRTLASCYNTIGTVYTRIQDYEKSYEYYRKALQVRIQINYDQGIGQSYNNLGELFIEMKKYDSALINLTKAVDIRRQIKDERGLGRSLTLIGDALIQSGKPAEAATILRQALAISKAGNDHIAKTAALNALGAASLSLNNYHDSERHLLMALALIRSTGTAENLRRNLELTAELYRRAGDKSKLISTLDQLLIVKDSLLNAEKVEDLLALEIKYETEKKEREIILLQQSRKIDQAELEKNQNLIWGLIVGILLLVTIAVLMYRLYRVSQHAQVLAELHSKEQHHRIKNSLQMLTSFFTIQASLLKDEKAVEVIKGTEGRVNAMALIHKKLFKSETASDIDLKEYVMELAEYLLFSYGYQDRLKLDIAITSIRIEVDKSIRIGLILNELITNALKYAYNSVSKATMMIEITRIENSVVIKMGDNGNEPILDIENKASFGLKMVKSLVQELRGKLEVSSKNGTHYAISIPI